MDAAVEAADLERRGGIGVGQFAQRKFAVKQFVGVEAGGNGPRIAVGGEAEFGQFVRHAERIRPARFVFVAESQPVVEYPEAQRQPHAAAVAQPHGHFVVSAAVLLVLAPRLGPRLIDARARHILDGETTAEIGLGSFESQSGRFEQPDTAVRNRIGHASGGVYGERQTDRAIGGGNPGIL